MATAKSKKPKPLAFGEIAYEDMTPSQQLGADILGRFSDLAPSVRAILDAPDLDEDGRMNAMTLFEVSLSTPGDPHRDPRRAIAAAQASS